MEENKDKKCDCGSDCQCDCTGAECGPDCECNCHEGCGCTFEEGCACNGPMMSKKKYAFALIALGLILVAAVVVISILRDRIVNPSQSQITVYGEGKVEYVPDTAAVTLGVRVDKAATAAEALTQMNDKIKKITDAVVALGVPMENIKTQNYNLFPAYDYKDGSSSVAGYNASQSLQIKAEEVDKNTDLVNQIVAAAGNSGTNDVQGVNYYLSNPNELRQKARIAAISDARQKATDLANAAGIRKLGKVLSWYEDAPNGGPIAYGATDSAMGLGAGPMAAKEISVPQISSGTQDIVVDMAVIFEVE